jgi:hypothetical protein
MSRSPTSGATTPSSAIGTKADPACTADDLDAAFPGLLAAVLATPSELTGV